MWLNDIDVFEHCIDMFLRFCECYFSCDNTDVFLSHTDMVKWHRCVSVRHRLISRNWVQFSQFVKLPLWPNLNFWLLFHDKRTQCWWCWEYASNLLTNVWVNIAYWVSYIEVLLISRWSRVQRSGRHWLLEEQDVSYVDDRWNLFLCLVIRWASWAD